MCEWRPQDIRARTSSTELPHAPHSGPDAALGIHVCQTDAAGGGCDKMARMSSLPDSMPAPPLLLRRWDEADLPEVVAAIGRSIEDLRLWMDWAVDGVPSIESERMVCRSGSADFDRDADWQYSLREIETGELVGGCGLHPAVDTGRVKINYWVRSDRHGLGYATVATHRLTDAAFEMLSHVREVQIRMDCANVASARIPTKLGYQLAAEEAFDVLAHGHTGRGLVWSMTRDVWNPPSGSEKTQPT